MKDPLALRPSLISTYLDPIAQAYGIPNLPLHIHEVIASYFFYSFLMYTISPRVSPLISRTTYKSLSAKTRVNWDMRVSAFLQAVIISGLALWVKSVDVEVENMDWRARLWGYSGGVGMLQGFAAGYFVWDLEVCIRYYSMLGPETLAHAVSALGMILLAFRPYMMYYGLNIILYEISTPFLNIHWYLDKLNLTGSKIQLVNGILLVTSFFLCRLVWGSYNIICMMMDVWTAFQSKNIAADYAAGMSWNPTMLKGIRKQDSYDPMPLWLVGALVGGNLVLWVLNVYWLGQMIKAMRKRFTPAAKVAKKVQ